MTNPLTEATWAARGPSFMTRDDPTKSRYQQAAELAYMDGSQPAHRGVEVAGKGLGRRKEYDAAGMLELHLEGCTWREVGRAFGVCAGTARDVVMEEFPHRVKRRGDYKVKPGSQIVLRNQSDADKTGRIQGTGVRA